MSRRERSRTAHESFIWPKRRVDGRWDKVRAVGADVDSLGEEAEDDEFRLKGGISFAVRESSREDPFSSSLLDDDMIIMEEAGSLGVPLEEMGEFFDKIKNP